MSSLPADEGLAGIPSNWWLRLGHDLRGPIAPMRMAVQMIRGGLVGATEKEEALRMIDRQIDLLLGGIEDLGDLMRLNAGTFAFHAGAADLRPLLDRVANRSAIERWLGERKLALALDTPVEALVAVHDPQRLLSLLDFLVRKAGRHAAPGSTLVLELRPAQGRARWSLRGAGPSLDADPELGYLAGNDALLAECEAHALVMREIIRRHGMAFEACPPGGVVLSMEAQA